MEIEELFQRLKKEGKVEIVQKLHALRSLHLQMQWHEDSREWEKDVLSICGENEVYNELRKINQETVFIYPVTYAGKICSWVNIKYNNLCIHEIYLVCIPRMYIKNTGIETFKADFMGAMRAENFGYTCCINSIEGCVFKKTKEYELMDINLIPYAGYVRDANVNNGNLIKIPFVDAVSTIIENFELFMEYEGNSVLYPSISDIMLPIEIPNDKDYIIKAIEEELIEFREG